MVVVLYTLRDNQYFGPVKSHTISLHVITLGNRTRAEINCIYISKYLFSYEKPTLACV